MGDPLTSVLHIIDTGGPGGAETVFKGIVTGLAERERQLAVVPNVDWLHGALVAEGIEPVVVPSLETGGVRLLLRLASLVREHRIGLVHTHLLGASVYGSLAAAWWGIPAVCTFHGLPDVSGSGGFGGIKARILSRHRNRIVFVSRTLRDRVLERLRFPPEIVRVVYNGIEPCQVSPRGTEREELGARPGEFVVGAVGNVRPAKDYATLLCAVARLRAEGQGVRLIVMGEGGGPLLEELLDLRSELGLDAVAEFLGFREDVPRLMTACDVVVSSSESEGFSLSTVEALWLGRPVVATRSGGPEEIIRHGETGWLVPTGDPDALASAIGRVLAEPHQARSMAEAGRADVQKRFSTQRMLERYQEIYREVLDA